MMKKIMACGVLLAMSFAALPAFAAGAIAVDDQQGNSARDAGYGFVTGYSSRKEAARAAMEKCESYGNDACKVVVRFDSCGAYAGSRDYYGIGWGDSEREAQKAALSQCGGGRCRIVTSGCE